MKIPNSRPPAPDHRPRLGLGLSLGEPPAIGLSAPAFVNVNINVNDQQPPAFHLSPSTPQASRGAAFSLTEVVIALGIFAVSMTGILALFPVASASGRESSEETQAAILAQMIFDEIRDSADVRNFTNAITFDGPNTVRPVHLQPVNLSSQTNLFIAYDVKRRDASTEATDGPGMMGGPIALKALSKDPDLTAEEFTNGVADANYLAQLQVFPLESRSRLTQLTLRIDTPGNLAATNRRSFLFTTRISGR